MLQAASASAAPALLSEPERALLAAVDALGYPAAIFPGDEPSRRTIDSSIAALEAASPTPSPLRQPECGGAPSPLLLGDWELIYASSGTYLTRSGGAQALLTASVLPGVGVSGIRQGLQLSGGSSRESSSSGSGSSSSNPSQPQLRTSNAATLGLGPFGDWEIVIEGVWAVRDGQLARVTFDGFSLQLVGLFDAIRLPRMAKVSIPIQNSRAADFSTTYLSEGLRVARGSTGNLFLFRRQPPAAAAPDTMAHLQAYKGLAWGHVEGAAVSLSRLSLGGVPSSGQQVNVRLQVQQAPGMLQGCERAALQIEAGAAAAAAAPWGGSGQGMNCMDWSPGR